MNLFLHRSFSILHNLLPRLKNQDQQILQTNLIFLLKTSLLTLESLFTFIRAKTSTLFLLHIRWMTITIITGANAWNKHYHPRTSFHSLMVPFLNLFFHWSKFHCGIAAIICSFMDYTNPSSSHWREKSLFWQHHWIVERTINQGQQFWDFRLLKDLHSIKQGDCTISAYFTDLKLLWDELEFLCPIHIYSCSHSLFLFTKHRCSYVQTQWIHHLLLKRAQ